MFKKPESCAQAHDRCNKATCGVSWCAGYRLPRPSACPDDVYALMLECWEEDIDKRCNIHYVVTQIETRLATKYNRMRRNFSSDSNPVETSAENGTDASNPDQYTVLSETVLGLEGRAPRRDDDQTYTELIVPSVLHCQEWRHAAVDATENPTQPDAHGVRTGSPSPGHEGSVQTAAAEGGAREDPSRQHEALGSAAPAKKGSTQSHVFASGDPATDRVPQLAGCSGVRQWRSDSESAHSREDTSSVGSHSSNAGAVCLASQPAHHSHMQGVTFEAGDHPSRETTV